MADTGTTQDAGAPTDTQASEDKSFTQADVDRIVQERLARAKTAPPADYDDLKAKASKWDEQEAANATELDKANQRAEAAESAAADALARVKTSTVNTSVTAAAVKAGAVDVDTVLALVDRNAVTVGDDGQVTGADEAVTALLESKPFLVGKPPRRQGSRDPLMAEPDPGRPRQLSREDLKGMKPQEIAKARREGRITFSGGG